MGIPSNTTMIFFTNNEWQRSLKNSLIIAPIATIISVSLGTLAAIGLSQSHVPFKGTIMAILISPMIVPLIISATGMFFFYSSLGNWMENNLGLDKNFVGYIKVILAHAVLGIPFVIITVTATLVGFDKSLTRAAANMGANPVTTFFRVQMPLILPGVISGGLFAFITSFDEVVVVLFVRLSRTKDPPMANVHWFARTDQPNNSSCCNIISGNLHITTYSCRIAKASKREIARHVTRLTPI